MVNIDFSMPRFCASAKLVLSEGQCEQEIRPGVIEIFDFRAEICERSDKVGADIVYGVASVPGADKYRA